MTSPFPPEACQRNDIARIQALILSGALPVTDLHVIEVRHEPGCPKWLSAQNLECSCQPSIWVNGVEVKGS